MVERASGRPRRLSCCRIAPRGDAQSTRGRLLEPRELHGIGRSCRRPSLVAAAQSAHSPGIRWPCGKPRSHARPATSPAYAGNLAANSARLIAVERAEALRGSRTSCRTASRGHGCCSRRKLMKLQTCGFRFEGHPGERTQTTGYRRDSRPDIGVHASKPNLLQASVVLHRNPRGRARRSCARRRSRARGGRIVTSFNSCVFVNVRGKMSLSMATRSSSIGMP